MTGQSKQKNCAFVASGGGLKAYAFHSGVLRALEENGFERQLIGQTSNKKNSQDDRYFVNVYIGSSAGACIAVGCAVFESVDDFEGVIGVGQSAYPRFNRQTMFRPNLDWLRLRKKSGFFYADRIEKYFRDCVRINDFTKIAPQIYICATQLNSSRKVIFGPKDSAVDGKYDPFIAYYNDVSISDAVAASVSVPGYFRPYAITNKRSGEIFEYIDGEVRETLSLHVARDNNVDLVIVSNMWMPYHYDRKYGSVSRMGLSRIITQTLTQIVEQKIDRFRNEADRYVLVIDAVRDYGLEKKLDSALVDELIDRICSELRYRWMEEIYVVPDRFDSKFNLAPAWTFNKEILRFASNTGYDRTQHAIEKWRQRSSNHE